MPGIERLEEVIKELSIIREQVRHIAYKAPIDPAAERKILLSKGTVAWDL